MSVDGGRREAWWWWWGRKYLLITTVRAGARIVEVRYFVVYGLITDQHSARQREDGEKKEKKKKKRKYVCMYVLTVPANLVVVLQIVTFGYVFPAAAMARRSRSITPAWAGSGSHAVRRRRIANDEAEIEAGIEGFILAENPQSETSGEPRRWVPHGRARDKVPRPPGPSDFIGIDPSFPLPATAAPTRYREGQS